MSPALERFDGDAPGDRTHDPDILISCFDDTSDGFLLIDADGRIADANDAASELTGIPPEDLMGASFGDIQVTGSSGIVRRDGVTVQAEITMRSLTGGRTICRIRPIHDCSLAEEDLRLSEEKYRTLVENTNDVVFSADESGIVTYVSPAIERMTGRTAEAVTGRPFTEFIHPDDLPGLVQSFRNTLENRLESYEFRIFAADGSTLHVRTSSRPHFSGGRLVGITGVMVDLTARKLAEDELGRYRERLEDLVAERTSDLARANRMLKILTDCNQTIVRGVDENTLLQSVCDLIADAGGYPLAWVGLARDDGSVGVAARAGRHSDFLDSADIRWVDTANGRGPTGTTIRTGLAQVVRDTRTGEGLEPWRDEALRRGFLSSMSLPIRCEGAVTGALTIYAPVEDAFHEAEADLLNELASDLSFGITALRQRTARNQAEKALIESEARYRGLVEMSPDAIAVHDGRQLLFVNSAAADLMGLEDKDSAIGMSVLGFVHPDSRPIVAARVREMLSEWKMAPLVEERFQKVDGTPVDVETVAMAVMWEGTPAVQVSFRDISGRKRAEAERDRLQAQLVQAQKMELLGSLAGGLAHDFNNMLAVILGHAELMRGGLSEGDPLLGELGEIEKAARRSSDLTMRLLAFARKQTIAPRVLDLNSTISALLGMLGRLIGEGIDLVWRPADDLWAVRVDPVQIDQVLTNLCVNARDAISGVGTVIIETRNVRVREQGERRAHHLPAGEYVLLSVSDDGSGMDETTQAHLFEPFFTTKETGLGTGLGLATVYGIVKQNNGFIDVITAPREGSTFLIHLPRDPGRAEPAQATAPGMQAGPARGMETILLVEDEPGILAVCHRILEELGYTVLSADTPGRAMELAGENRGRIDLLVTDVVMPQMNGPELYRRLVADMPDLDCLYMSGYSADFISRQGVLDESVNFIQKPFSMNELADGIRKALGHRRE